MRSVWLATDTDPILTPEQVKGLETFFADVDESKRRRAIWLIDTGVKQYHAEKKNPLDPLGAARQVTRIKAGLQAVIDELHKLTPAAGEAMHLAATKRAEHGDTSFWKLCREVEGRELVSHLVNVQVLCALALREMPAVDKDGRKGRGRPKGRLHAKLPCLTLALSPTDREKQRCRDGRCSPFPDNPLATLPVSTGRMKKENLLAAAVVLFGGCYVLERR